MMYATSPGATGQPNGRPAEILTARLRLVPLKPADLGDLAQMYSDPDVMLGSSGVAAARSREDSEEWLRHALATSKGPFHRTFRVECRGDGAFVGRCGLRPDSKAPETELALAFVQAAWGRGIATEAAQAILEWGRTKGLKRVIACVLASNMGSQRVLVKIGMRRVGERPAPYGPLVLFEMDLA
jgi:RimJ/RimL family protein N-acetyltransferase